MEKCLFAILFFQGVVLAVLPVYREYHLIQQARTWSDAQAYCRANFDDLATIESNADITRLQSESQSQRFSSNAWIGLYTESSGWHWSLANQSLGADAQLNPAALSSGNEGCALLSFYAGWWDISCTSSYPFICFDEPWKWSDQTSFSPITWMTGKPDNAQGNKNCIYLYNGEAADTRCSDIMPFFCQVKVQFPREQQTIKVKVQSSQDVNDPVLKKAILEKIKQKVKEHGLPDNTTVTWRVQPVVWSCVSQNKNNNGANIKVQPLRL